MAGYIKVASITFDDSEENRNRDKVLEQLKHNAEEMAGYDLDLAVFCESRNRNSPSE